MVAASATAIATPAARRKPFIDPPVSLGRVYSTGFARSPGMLARFKVPLSWADIAKRTGKEAITDNIFDLAAQQAYYFFFALFPALLFALSIASFFPLASLTDNVVKMLGRVAPRDVIDIINTQLL